MRILLIDDDKDLCQLTQKILIQHGYAVDAFCDAKEGIKHARAIKPNLILMDIIMPGLSGPEIVRSLKEDPQFKEIPVIFFTALVTGNEKELEDKGITVGGIEYQTLGKPYEIERMLALVKKYAR